MSRGAGGEGLLALVVVDLGFGDCGKGLITDYLVREHQARVVVRYNGGAQAGHNVVAPGGVHHTFAQFGAGTFAGARTFLSRYMVVHPTALLVEAEVLRTRGISDPFALVRVSERARVITPFHQAANRLRELARGAARHGSCGVGVGETVAHALAHPEEAVACADLRDAEQLALKLDGIRRRLADEIAPLAARLASVSAAEPELALLASEAVAGRWIRQATELVRHGIIVPDSALAGWLAGTPAVVFEGAQGVLLDEDLGFHPHTTWSCCTARNARAILATVAPAARIQTVGVLRGHAVRHGAGPLPTADASVSRAVAEHNRENPWQGDVRHGWFDAPLARYALAAAGDVDRLVVTHLDLVPRLSRPALCVRYENPECEPRLPASRPPTLEGQARQGERLLAARPVLEPAGPDEEGYLAAIERTIGRSVDLVSRGPRATDVAPRRRAR